MRVLLFSVLLCACSGRVVPGGDPWQPMRSSSSSPPAAAAARSCERSELGPPLLRRLTRQQIENTYRDAFPQLGADWQGFQLSDVSSALGFSNDADVLVVSPQTSEQLLASAEQLADLLTDTKHASALDPCVATQLDAACASRVLVQAGTRLFRRPMQPDDLQRYVELYAQAGLKWSLVALLQSPHTLYRRELGDTGRKLDAYELASELSYTFSDSPPDAELSELASRDALGEPKVRVAQARRLLQSPRGHETLRGFFREWLRYGAVTTADRPTVDAFAAVRGKLADETERFIEEVVYRDEGGLRGLLTAPYSAVDRELATYYGWAEPASDWARVTRPNGHGIGVLAQGALLASASNAGASSPTQRGLRVFERFLCNTKPRPPANVPPLENSDPGSYRTTRQHYEDAHSQGVCASCHVHFDPLGFAFEHFDSGGRFRADEAGEPIDASGFLNADGSRSDFAGQADMAERLAGSTQVAECVSGLLVQYAFGGAGRCVAEDARAAFREGASFVDTLARLAAAEHFARRAGGSEDVPALSVDAGSDAAADGGSALDIGVTAQYLASNSTPKDNILGPYLQIVNRGGEPVALDALELRYYFSNERAARCPDGCVVEGYYAGIHPAGKGVEAVRRYVSVDGPRAYLAIGFAPGSPQLMPGESVEVQQQFHTSPYEDFDESDDYSFDAASAAFADTDKVTIYRAGTRVWGTPPDWD